MTEILLVILGILIFSLVDLLCIAARYSFREASTARLLSWREKEEPKVEKTLAMITQGSRVAASLTLPILLARFSVAGFIVLFLTMLQFNLYWWVYVGALLIGALLLFWLEWVIERAVSRSPEKWAVRLTSFTKAVTYFSSVFLLPLGISQESFNSEEATASVTEDEVMTLVDAGEEEGVFEQEERQRILSIFQLGDTLAREIMVPRIDMLALDANTPPLSAVDALLESGHSRVPVFEENVDNTLGVLYAKDLLRVWREGNKLESLRELLRPAYFVPEAKKVDEMLTEMQSQRIHIGIVVDEYGGIAGLVTLEDILEEIFGEIHDEYDQGEELPYQIMQDGEYMFLGRVDLDDFNDLMDSELPTNEADTLGGFIYSRLGHVPSVGESVQEDNLLLTVEQVSARRIRKVHAQRIDPALSNDKSEQNVE